MIVYHSVISLFNFATLCLCFVVSQPSEASTTAGVEDIEKRMQALEVGAQYDATKSEVQKVEQEFLMKLREIRAAITAEAQAGGGGTSSLAAVAGATKELEALRAENELLKKRNGKLEYRVEHVVNELMVLHDEHNHLMKKTKDIVDSRASF
jgi:Skp family chaperone for outer membrane proteins